MIVRDPDQVGQLVLPNARIANKAALLGLVERCGALLDRHFSLQSGEHSRYFLRYAAIGRDRRGGDEAAQRVLEERLCPADLGEQTTILCPESAGFFLGHALHRQTGAELVVSRVDAHRRPAPIYRRGRIRAGREVVLVNDVISTGASLRPLIELVRREGARLAGVFAFAATNEQRARQFFAEIDVPAEVALITRWETWSAPCPLCRPDGPELLPASEFN